MSKLEGEGRRPSRPPCIISLICIAILFVNLLASCSPGPRQRKSKREDLFRLGYGSGAGRLDFSRPESSRFDVVVREGIFYVLDPANRKVLKLSSYGDILKIFRDREGIAPGLEAPEAMAVDSGQRLYLADRIADPGAAVYDETAQTSCDRAIRRIHPGTEEMPALGQEGPGGSPFPPIISLRALEDDSLAVVSASESHILVHRFSNAGDLLSSARFSRTSLPLPESMKQAVQGLKDAGEYYSIHASLDSIFPRLRDGRFEILAKIDYYNEPPARSGKSGTDYAGTWVFTADGDTGRFTGALKAAGEEDEAPEFLGSLKGRLYFLYSGKEPDERRIVALDSNGIVQARYSLALPPGSRELAVLKPLGGGILVGAATREEDVAIFWWRLEDETSS